MLRYVYVYIYVCVYVCDVCVCVCVRENPTRCNTSILILLQDNLFRVVSAPIMRSKTKCSSRSLVQHMFLYVVRAVGKIR
jgi:hypothetical protein